LSAGPCWEGGFHLLRRSIVREHRLCHKELIRIGRADLATFTVVNFVSAQMNHYNVKKRVTGGTLTKMIEDNEATLKKMGQAGKEKMKKLGQDLVAMQKHVKGWVGLKQAKRVFARHWTILVSIVTVAYIGNVRGAVAEELGVEQGVVDEFYDAWWEDRLTSAFLIGGLPTVLQHQFQDGSLAYYGMTLPIYHTDATWHVEAVYVGKVISILPVSGDPRGSTEVIIAYSDPAMPWRLYEVELVQRTVQDGTAVFTIQVAKVTHVIDAEISGIYPRPYTSGNGRPATVKVKYTHPHTRLEYQHLLPANLYGGQSAGWFDHDVGDELPPDSNMTYFGVQ
jgi:hypothetical protein